MYEYPLNCEDCGTQLGNVSTEHERAPGVEYKSGMICESCAEIRNANLAQIEQEEKEREEALDTIIDQHLEKAPAPTEDTK